MPGFIIGQQATPSSDIPSSKVEIRRRHRWKFTTTGPSSEIAIYASQADRPTVVVDVVNIHYQQDVIYVPAKNKWNPIDVTFYEVDNPDVAKKIQDWIETVVKFQTSALQSSGFKQHAELSMLDGMGKVQLTYELLGAWPSEINPDGLDYETSDLSKIKVKLYYDKAKLVKV